MNYNEPVPHGWLVGGGGREELHRFRMPTPRFPWLLYYSHSKVSFITYVCSERCSVHWRHRCRKRFRCINRRESAALHFNRTMVSHVSTAYFKFLCCVLTRVWVNVTSCLCWDILRRPRWKQRGYYSAVDAIKPPIHHGMNMKWALQWRSPPPQGRQGKVTSWEKSSIKIRWFSKQSSVC